MTQTRVPQIAHPGPDPVPLQTEFFPGAPGSDTTNTRAAVAKPAAYGIRSARTVRMLQALLQGPKSREQLDRIAGTSNSPEYIRRLREAGFDVPSKWIAHVDRDGRAGRHGQYRLSDADRRKLRGTAT